VPIPFRLAYVIERLSVPTPTRSIDTEVATRSKPQQAGRGFEEMNRRLKAS